MRSSRSWNEILCLDESTGLSVPWVRTDRLLALLCGRVFVPNAALGVDIAAQALAPRASWWPRAIEATSEPYNPWSYTDHCIAQLCIPAFGSSNESSTTQLSRKRGQGPSSARPSKKSKVRHEGTSHYWPRHQNHDEGDLDTSFGSYGSSLAGLDWQSGLQGLHQGHQNINLFTWTSPQSCSLESHYSRDDPIQSPCYAGQAVKHTRQSSRTSHYFDKQVVDTKESPKKKPPPSTVSSIAFPPLDASCFGLIQEKMGGDPFWLLVAVTFLIRTAGKTAVPVFYKIKERFPSPAHLADSANNEDIIEMIRHLGLSAVRLSFVQRYAKAFVEDPPVAGTYYRVKGYDLRDVNLEDDEILEGLQEEGRDAWEIGHMTKGKYALDSWRIFCRDQFLGRAADWNGKGRGPEFQPEWMRVRPTDKELRACLRWMWMREGWEWDPATGERTVLREELRRAVNEGRVEYDDTGGLRILEQRANPE